MELKQLTENFLFIAIFVIGFLPLIAVMLLRVSKGVRVLLIVSAALALLASNKVLLADILCANDVTHGVR